MTTITATVPAAPDEVFGVITDVDRLPEWNGAIRSVVEPAAVVAEGAEWVVELHALGQTWHSRSTVRELDRAARRFVHRSCTDDGNPSWVEWRWEVADHPQGSEVRVTFDLHPVTFWRRVLFARVRARQLAGREVPASLGALAGAVASGPHERRSTEERPWTS